MEVNESIYPSYIDNTNFKYIKVDDKYIASIIIYDYPKSNYFLSIIESIPKDCEYTMCVYIQKQDTYKILKELTCSLSTSKSEINTAKGSQIDIDVIERSKDDATMLRREIQINNQEVFYINFILTFYSNSSQELLKLLKRFQSKLYSKQVFSKIANFRHLDEYILSLPFCKNNHQLLKQNYRNFTTNSLCNMFLFYTKTIFDPNGVIFGRILKGNIICNIDMFKKNYLNSNMCILGSSGAGKSYFSKILLIRHFMNNKKQYVFDVEGEYNNVVDKLGGSIFLFSKNHINIMQITKEEIFFLKEKVFEFKVNEVLNLLIKCLKISDGSYENELRDSIINAYKKFNINSSIDSLYIKDKNKVYLNGILRENKEFPTLYDVILELTSKYLKDRINILEAKFPFLFGITDVNFDNRLVLFDLSNIDILECSFVIKYVLQKIILNLKLNKEIKKVQDTLIYIDEVWKYFSTSDNNVLGKYIFELFKTIRKLNAGVIVITQDISDLFSKKNINYGKSILNNCFFKVIFKLDFNDINTLNKISGLNREILDNINLLEKGESLISFNNNNTKLIIEANSFEKNLIEGDSYKDISSFG